MEQALEPKLITLVAPSVHEAWEMVSSQLRMEMTRGVYESWVQPLKPLSFKEGVFRLGAANSFTIEWVESRLRSRITRLLESIYARAVTVHFTVTLPGSAAAPDVPAGEQTVERADLALQPGGAGEGLAEEPEARATKKSKPAAIQPGVDNGSPRKIQLQRAYGTERARIIQPERGLFLTMYFFNSWLPLLGHSAATTVLAARSLCYWNPMTGELRNLVETDMAEIARRAAVSVRTVKDVLNNELVRRYFLRYKVRRVMTPNGVRTAGILLQVRMDDPLTPEDQDQHHLPEDEHWFSTDFDDSDLNE
jgi:hypothetical protein